MKLCIRSTELSCIAITFFIVVYQISYVLSKFPSQRYILQDTTGNILLFSYKTPSESYIECSLYCLRDVSCLGVVFDDTTKTCKSYTDICKCEVDPLDPKSKKVMTKEPTCDTGWVTMYGHCYFVGLSPTKTWENAKVDCLQRGSNLAKIDNECETSCISVYLRGKTKIEPYYWIGANDMNTEGLFVWSVDNTSITYSDWVPGDPNNYDNGIEDEDCVAFTTISYYRNFGWIDSSCGGTFSYFCEK